MKNSIILIFISLGSNTLFFAMDQKTKKLLNSSACNHELFKKTLIDFTRTFGFFKKFNRKILIKLSQDIQEIEKCGMFTSSIAIIKDRAIAWDVLYDICHTWSIGLLGGGAGAVSLAHFLRLFVFVEDKSLNWEFIPPYFMANVGLFTLSQWAMSKKQVYEFFLEHHKDYSATQLFFNQWKNLFENISFSKDNQKYLLKNIDFTPKKISHFTLTKTAHKKLKKFINKKE